MNSKIRVFLAKSYDLVVGDTFQLFYRGVIEAPNPYCYSIVTQCEKGKAFPRYYEYTPQEEGKHTLTISVYDAEKTLLGSATTTLNVVSAKAPMKKVNVLCLGDSLTQGGTWVQEVNRRICKVDGTPEGNGFSNVNFIGSMKKGDVGFEGHGGWTWNSYVSDKVGSIWIQAPNNKTEKDQHSLWLDEFGSIWQIETLQVDYLKLNRYKDHEGKRPEKGILTHYKNAVDTSPIEFFSSSNGDVSPFLDTKTKALSVKKYLESLSEESVDVVYIILGANGLMRQCAMNKSRREYCQTIIKQEVKELLNLLIKDIPNVKIKIMAMPIPSVNGGMGSNYGAEPPFNDLYDIITYATELNVAYQEICLEDAYKNYVEFIHLAGQFDSEYNYPNALKPVNTRSQTTERVDTNALHPNIDGQMQIADAVYRNLIKEIAK